jgi:hypothetical protein
VVGGAGGLFEYAPQQLTNHAFELFWGAKAAMIQQ